MKELEKIENSLREKIDSIMDCFDFNKVRVVMKYLNWRWAFSESKDGVPEEYELRREARKLLVDLVNVYIKGKMEGKETNVLYIATGGFRAQIAYDILSLSFEVESWHEEDILNQEED